MFKHLAKQTRSSLDRPRSGMYTNREAPVLKTKVRNLMLPPVLRPELADDEMDASFFVATWDMCSRGIESLAAMEDLLPRHFDVYVIGVHACKDLPEAVHTCLLHLCSGGEEYSEFSHLMVAAEAGRPALGLMVIVRTSLVEQGSMSMSQVDTVPDRRFSMMPMLRDRSVLHLSTPQTLDDAAQPLGKQVEQPDFPATSGGPSGVSMRFDFFDTNLLFVHVKQSCIDDLSALFCRVRPEDYAHVFLFGDFGNDVLDKASELAARLRLEDFDEAPALFKKSRYMVVTRSQDKAMGELLFANLHGHYSISRPRSATGSAALPAAAYATYRVHGGAGIERGTVPPPPQASARNLRVSHLPPPLPYEDDDDDAVDGFARDEDDRDDDGEPATWDPRSGREASFPPPPPPPPPPPEPFSGHSSHGRKVARAARRAHEAEHKSQSSDEGEAPRRSRGVGARSAQGSLLRRAMHSLRLTADPLRARDTFGTCTVCREAIRDAADMLQTMGKKYHRDCVRCDDCGERIESQFYIVDGRMLCQQSYARIHLAQKCSGCGQTADPQDHLLRVEDKVFHIDCFKCAECDEQLSSIAENGTDLEAEDFVLDEDRGLLCAKHGAKQQCIACGEPAPARDAVQVVLDNGRKAVFHSGCFRCTTCDEKLADLGGVYVMYQDNFFCQEHYNALRAAAKAAVQEELRSAN